jgi:ribosome-associated translation inhibitor RaiA
MQVPLQISFIDMDPSPALEAKIRERADKLEQFFAGLISCHVIVQGPHHHRSGGRHYAVHIHLQVPGRELDVSRDPDDVPHGDAYVAVRYAFDAAARRLEDYARKRRGDVKRHERRTDPQAAGR